MTSLFIVLRGLCFYLLKFYFCFYNYVGTTKYSCKDTYYDMYDAAYEVCKNYCSSGTYYNGKCYKMS